MGINAEDKAYFLNVIRLVKSQADIFFESLGVDYIEQILQAGHVLTSEFMDSIPVRKERAIYFQLRKACDAIEAAHYLKSSSEQMERLIVLDDRDGLLSFMFENLYRMGFNQYKLSSSCKMLSSDVQDLLTRLEAAKSRAAGHVDANKKRTALLAPWESYIKDRVKEGYGGTPPALVANSLKMQQFKELAVAVETRYTEDGKPKNSFIKKRRLEDFVRLTLKQSRSK